MHNHSHSDSGKIEIDLKSKEKIILLGNPNVGKSVIFGLLTGKYVTVSNYPGTTVEITQGTALFGKGKVIIIDTPGTNSLIPHSEDERVARDMLLDENLKNLIQIADAKNLRRAIFISLQLAEGKIPFVLDLNMDDEARSRGISIDRTKLAQLFGIDVITTIATQRKGIKDLIKSIGKRKISSLTTEYDREIEKALEKIIALVPETGISKRLLSLMLLAGDESIKKYLSSRIDPGVENLRKIEEICKSLSSQYGKPLNYVINQQRMKKVDEILSEVMTQNVIKMKTISSVLGKLSMHSVWGIPIVIGVLYLMYKIVGEFGAGTCVDFLEGTVFGKYINPLMTRIFSIIPIKIVQDLFVGEYGLITMALTYAFAIVLPIVGFFFIVFGILEDSGYLPRLAIMVNKIFKIMGLNGAAVLPMVLGLGCGTMATMTARILPGKKERIIVTLLLALAIPCSAQLGVIFGGTAAISGKATLIWVGMIIGVILVVGCLASIVIPGKSSDFILEIPPMRLPKLSNIIIKTLARLEWYLKEAVPFFMLGTFVLFILAKTGLLSIIENVAAPVVVNLLQLPKEAAGAFVMGFLRRDYATVMMVKGGNLDPIQMLVAVLTITLFVPCVAQLFIMIKERGLKVAIAIATFVFVFAFLAGGAFNFILRFLKVSL